MNQQKKTNGITLIALVITIVVLIILASVSLNLILGKDGIVNKAKQSSEENKKAQALEEMTLIIHDLQIEFQGNATLSNLASKLKNDTENTYIIATDAKVASLTVQDGRGLTELTSITDETEAIFVTNLKYGYEIRVTKKFELSLTGTAIAHQEPETPKNEIAGLYDVDGNQIIKWSDLIKNYGIDVEYDFTISNYNTESTSPYVILNKEEFNNSVKKIIIPDTVIRIGNFAFYGCNNIIQIELPDSITSIGRYSFSGCLNLSSIVMSERVINIGASAFYGCGKLTEIKIPSGVTEIKEGTFNECKSLANVNILGNLTKIGNNAFRDCYELTTINIPDTVAEIGDWAFSGDKKLEFVSMPDSLQTIHSEAFINCLVLEEIIIPANVSYIYSNAFSGCSGLTKITFEKKYNWSVYKSQFSTTGIDVDVIDDSINVTNLT